MFYIHRSKKKSEGKTFSEKQRNINRMYTRNKSFPRKKRMLNSMKIKEDLEIVDELQSQVSDECLQEKLDKQITIYDSHKVFETSHQSYQ